MGSDTLSTAEGQVVHLNMDCFSFQIVVRLVGISLGTIVKNEQIIMIIT